LNVHLLELGAKRRTDWESKEVKLKVAGEKNKQDKEPEEIEFVDKRRFKPEDVKAEDAPAEEGQVQAEPDAEAGAKARSEAEAEEKQADEIPRDEPLDVYSLCKWFITMLSGNAFVWMGLVKNPSTGKLEKDLAQAKIAIDVCDYLAKHVQDRVDQDEKTRLASLLADLRINFVNQSKG
jgi:hypothetical protein